MIEQMAHFRFNALVQVGRAMAAKARGRVGAGSGRLTGKR
jgi:hypothetical protein